MIKIAITGAAGRMGRTLIEACTKTDGLRLAAAIERPGASVVGTDVGELAGVGKLGVVVSGKLDGLDFDVLVDFTRPEVTFSNLEYCHRARKRIVIGTTGFDDAGKARIAQAGKDIGIVFAPNM